MGRIVTIQLEGIRNRLAERRINLELTVSAEQWLAEHGYDAAFGARPLKRLIQRSIADALAKKLLAGKSARAASCESMALHLAKKHYRLRSTRRYERFPWSH